MTTSKSFGAAVGSATAASVNLVGAISTGTASAIADFAHGLGMGYSARRTQDEAAKSPRRAITAPVILIRG